MTATHTNVLVRMTSELKAQLQRESVVQGRSLTAEIVSRLRASIKHDSEIRSEMVGGSVPYSIDAPATVVHANDNGPAPALTDIDRAMLVIFHNLPPEKQLALLSLFR